MMYEIAGLKIEVRGSGPNTTGRMAEYALPLSYEGERSCNLGLDLRRGLDIPPPEGEDLGRAGFWQLWNLPEGRCATQRLPEPWQALLSDRLDFPDSGAGAALSFCAMDENQEQLREFLHLGLAFAQLMPAHKRLVLHSSCIVVQGRALLFSAPSGTGKSTHTALWKKYVPGVEYINDDTPALRLDRPEAVYACGSPWSGKTRLNANLSAPLAAAVFLERGTENVMEPLAPGAALPRLLGEVRKLPFRETMEQTAELCGQLLTRVPVYRLRCDISQGAVDAVRRVLEF